MTNDPDEKGGISSGSTLFVKLKSIFKERTKYFFEIVTLGSLHIQGGQSRDTQLVMSHFNDGFLIDSR